MAKQARDLNGKVVVITGGARGIGAATAKALVAEGARVVIGDLDDVATQETAGRLGVVGKHLDVTDPAGLRRFLDEVEAEVGPIYALINNAGIMPLASVQDEKDEPVVRQLEINLLAVIRGTKEAVNRLVPRRSGHIVNVASIAGKTGFPSGSTYCATKHGVVGYSEAVHLELRNSGVEVTCVMPAVVQTELAAGLSEARMVKSIQPEDVANAIVAALKFPRFDVFVPKIAGLTATWARILPRKWAEGIIRALKADQVLASGAHAPERADYERRASADITRSIRDEADGDTTAKHAR